jgi:outer membrane lipoprotein-sorting protein
MVMKKILFCLLMVSMLVTIPMLAACTCGTTPATTTPTTTTPATTTPTTTTPTTTTPTTTTPTTTTPEPSETLGEILGHAAGISSMKYDMIVTSPGGETMTTKIWVKNNKMRSEMTAEGQTVVTLLDMDARTMYVYYPDQNMAIEMTYEPAESAVDEAQSIPDYNPTITGTETLDGKVCLVVVYTAEGETVKMWIWKEHGFPVRAEMTTNEGTTVIEYKNIAFTDIPDSMFELPAGVEIMEMPGM